MNKQINAFTDDALGKLDAVAVAAAPVAEAAPKAVE